MSKKLITQPRIRGIKRTPVFSALLPEIEACIRADMKMFGVSRSYVIANHLAYVYDINVVDYRAPKIVARNATTRIMRKKSGYHTGT